MNETPELQRVLAYVDSLRQELDGYRPLSPEQTKSLKTVYDLQQTFHSNAIEGNTLSYEETRMVLEQGVTIAGKPLKDHLEAINHVEALGVVEALSQKPTAEISEANILKVHELILHGIDTSWAGKYRNMPVYITRQDGSLLTFADQAAVPSMMTALVNYIKDEAEKIPPIVLAAQVHFRLVNIHPFKDGNGRTARLLMNLVLMQNGYPPAVIHVDDRDRYIEAIEQARSGDKDVFALFIAKAAEHSLELTLKVVRNGGLVK